jgi:large subunit ribosomal protein L13
MVSNFKDSFFLSSFDHQDFLKDQVIIDPRGLNLNQGKITKAMSQLNGTDWFLIDAKNQTLGRLSTIISRLLCGKEKIWNFSQNRVPYVILINSQLIQVTGKKEKQKLYRRNSQRPGGLKEEVFSDLKVRFPNKILEHAISGMLPKNKDRKQLMQHIFVYNEDIQQDKRYSFFFEKMSLTVLNNSEKMIFQGGDR